MNVSRDYQNFSPLTSRPTVSATRFSRVSGRFASTIQSTYAFRCEGASPSKTAFAFADFLSAGFRSFALPQCEDACRATRKS